MHVLLTVLLVITYLSYYPMLQAQQEVEPEEVVEQAMVEAPEAQEDAETEEVEVPVETLPDAATALPETVPQEVVTPESEQEQLPLQQQVPEEIKIEEKVSVETSETKPPEVVEIKGIDTLSIDEPKGNWLLKRIWWEKGEHLYEKIMQVKQDILESRMFFFQKRTEFDRTVFDPFYVKIGFGQGELQEVISSLLTMIEKMRQDKGSLSEQQRAFIVTLELEQEALKGIEQKLKTVNVIDNSIDDAVLKLMEQINRAREYEHQAWQTFKSITRELSDKRARELYYTMDTVWRNIEKINIYIKDQFTPYFNQLIEKAQEIVDEMEAAITVLKEKGIDLKTQSQQFMQQPAAQSESQVEEEKQSTEDENQQEQGWLSWLYDLPYTIISGLGSIWDYISSFFVSKPVSEESSE